MPRSHVEHESIHAAKPPRLDPSNGFLHRRWGELAGTRADAARNDGDAGVRASRAVRHEDYAEARAAFRTKLLFEKPSPAQAARPAGPRGVEDVVFRSAGNELHAWLSLPDDLGSRKHAAAVLFLHGGFVFGVEDWQMSKPYRDAGFVVMTP